MSVSTILGYNEVEYSLLSCAYQVCENMMGAQSSDGGVKTMQQRIANPPTHQPTYLYRAKLLLHSLCPRNDHAHSQTCHLKEIDSECGSDREAERQKVRQIEREREKEREKERERKIWGWRKM